MDELAREILSAIESLLPRAEPPDQQILIWLFDILFRTLVRKEKSDIRDHSHPLLCYSRLLDAVSQGGGPIPDEMLLPLVDIYGRILGSAPICFQLNQILERLMRQGRIVSQAIGRIVQVLQGQIGSLDSIAISFLQKLPSDYSTRSAVIQKTFRDTKPCEAIRSLGISRGADWRVA
jgi:hypothetical protein